eukprot:8523891-Lingulodinium_polyedra.AAC.1
MAAVEAAMFSHLQGSVRASAALVYDPVTRSEQPAVFLRAPKGRVAIVTALVAAGFTIIVRGRQIR